VYLKIKIHQMSLRCALQKFKLDVGIVIVKILVCDVITPIIGPSISDEQHGFVGGRSTVTSLVEFSNFVLSEMEEDRLQVNADYTDFSKAFRLQGW
jgi:hypothetical protein